MCGVSSACTALDLEGCRSSTTLLELLGGAVLECWQAWLSVAVRGLPADWLWQTAGGVMVICHCCGHFVIAVVIFLWPGYPA
jgi:hypothetical protein